MVTKRFPIQLLFRIKHWWGQYVIAMDIMRVGFPSLVQAYSRYTAIKLLLFLPLPLAIKQGGYVDTSTGVSRDPVRFAISFTTTPGLAWTTNYATARCTHAVSLTGFNTTINYDRNDAKIWYIAIGI